MNLLKLTYCADDDGTAELFGVVQGNGFSGSGSAWFNTTEIVAFCDSLSTYPLESNSLPRLEGGFWSGEGNLEQTNLAISVAPYNSLGALKVTVELAEPAANNEPADRRRSVITWFIVGYNDLSDFQRDFARLLTGNAPEAVLRSTLP